MRHYYRRGLDHEAALEQVSREELQLAPNYMRVAHESVVVVIRGHEKVEVLVGRDECGREPLDGRWKDFIAHFAVAEQELALRGGEYENQATAPEPQPGPKGEGSCGGNGGRVDAGRVGPAVRRSSESDQAIARPAVGGRHGCVRGSRKGEAAPLVNVRTLHATNGELTLESGFLQACSERRVCC